MNYNEGDQVNRLSTSIESLPHDAGTLNGHIGVTDRLTNRLCDPRFFRYRFTCLSVSYLPPQVSGHVSRVSCLDSDDQSCRSPRPVRGRVSTSVGTEIDPPRPSRSVGDWREEGESVQVKTFV